MVCNRVSRPLFVTMLCLASVSFGADRPGDGRGAPMEKTSLEESAGRIRLLFLGDNGLHRPAERFAELAPALRERGIDLTYTGRVNDLNRQTLSGYHGLVVYANIDAITPPQEDALVAFVEGGNGLIVLHCGSFCFRNSDQYIRMVGGQFSEHDTGVFRARIIDAQHPAMQGVNSFETWDETYVHSQLRPDNRVLMVRDHTLGEAGGVEPYTWVRTHERGRVFYTALGHDGRTWTQPDFHRLVEGGSRWAVGAVDDLPPHTVAGELHPAGAPVGSEYRYPAPLSPEESMRRMHLPEGFSVELFAAEPMLRNPLAMAFDHRGRLWVAESRNYPNDLRANSAGDDELRILEDTDGDGRADKSTIFVDGLNIPTTLVFAGGGVIVNSGPRILLFRDTDGDDRADVGKLLFNGVGVWDTHATVNNFTYGLDNWIWGAVGYSGLKIEAGGKLHEMKMGFYRFKPDGSDFEAVTSTSNNTWGLGFTPDGDVLGSTANVDHSWFTAIPNRYYEKVRGWHGRGSAYNADHRRSHPILLPARQWDHAGGFTSTAGATAYAARQFPEPYRERAMFVCEPTIHLIHTNLLVRDGSHVVSRDGYNLLASDDPWCAPIQTTVGPDGALWIIDAYSYSVLHNKPDEPKTRHGKGNAWVTSVRDLERARIYRVAYQPRPGASAPGAGAALDADDPATLVAALGHDNMFWRMTAQRLLVESQMNQVLPALRRLANEPGLGAVHALWTMHGLGALDGSDGQSLQAATAALAHPSAAVRRAAVSTVPRSAEVLSTILSNGLLTDANGPVRLAAMLAMSEMEPSTAAGEAILTALAQPLNASDRWIPQAATSAAATHSPSFLSAALSGYPQDAPQVEAPRRAIAQVVKVVAAHWGHHAPAEEIEPILLQLTSAERMVRLAVLEGLVNSRPASAPGAQRLALTGQSLSSLRALVKSTPIDEAEPLIVLAQRWGQEQVVADLARQFVALMRQRLADAALSAGERIDAAQRLIRIDDSPESVAVVLEPIAPQQPPDLVGGMLDALAQSRSAETGAAIAARWPQLSPSSYRRAVAVLLRRAEWAGSLLDGIEQGRIHRGDLTAEQAQQLVLHGDPAIAPRAKSLLAAGSATDADREQLVQKLLPLAQRSGNTERGRATFAAVCAQCHSLDGVGGKIGPDLTGIGARPREQLLIDIIDPNRSVEANYRLWTVSTKDGQTVSGRLVSETQTTVTILDLAGQERPVQRGDILAMSGMPLSIMPAAFDDLPAEDLAGVLELLSLSKGE